MREKIFSIIIPIFIFIFNLEIIYAQIQKKPIQTESEYIIYPNDLLEITVYEEPDLTKVVRVARDGLITYPLLGSIKAAGLTAKQLEVHIKELLEVDYLVNPQVSVFIKEHAKISILGQVRDPKSYELRGSLTLIEAIALAGGFTDQGDPSRVKVIRIEEGKEKTILIDTLEITERGDRTKDILLKPGDVINVEEYGRITIFGQVAQPGPYLLKKNLSLLRLIALAGGFTDQGNPSKVKITRIEEGKEKTILIDTLEITERGDRTKDILLKPGDVINVEEYGRITIFGQVAQPGAYTFKKNLTILEAIALAGGFTDTADIDRTRIIRLEDGKKRTISVKVSDITKRGNKSKDIVLKPNDTIIVPESFF